MKKNETKLVCPNCGAEFEIGQHECNVKNATVIGADSGLGTIYLKLKDREEQLNKAGIDTSKYFSMRTPGGAERLMKWDGDIPVAVDADDPVLKVIFDSGTVPNRDLFRRWVMAQVFQGLIYENKYSRDEKGFTDWVHRKGYKYTWDMTQEEFRVQAKLHQKDKENWLDRNHWFNREMAVDMIDDYLKKLKETIDSRKVHKCKGNPYICIGGRQIFKSDIHKKVYLPLQKLRHDVATAGDPQKLYIAFLNFNKSKIGLEWRTRCSSRWMDAYKGAGAFYTMKNLILFHGCKFRYDNGQFMTKNSSISYLIEKANEYKSEGWRLFGMMKKLIADNGIDINAKRAEWRKARELKKA